MSLHALLIKEIVEPLSIKVPEDITGKAKAKSGKANRFISAVVVEDIVDDDIYTVADLVSGEYAQGGSSVTIATDTLISDIDFENILSITRLKVSSLKVTCHSVQVVLPLASGVTIHKDASCRKFSKAKAWFTFFEDKDVNSNFRHLHLSITQRT
jgi:hypothetical protein